MGLFLVSDVGIYGKPAFEGEHCPWSDLRLEVAEASGDCGLFASWRNLTFTMGCVVGQKGGFIHRAGKNLWA